MIPLDAWHLVKIVGMMLSIPFGLWVVWRPNGRANFWQGLFITIGASCNLSCVVANGWRMPTAFYGLPGHSTEAIYIPLSFSTQLPLLCDWLWMGTSPGDWMLLTSLVAGVLAMLREQA